MKGYNPLAEREVGRFHDGPMVTVKGFLQAVAALIEASPMRFPIEPMLPDGRNGDKSGHWAKGFSQYIRGLLPLSACRSRLDSS